MQRTIEHITRALTEMPNAQNRADFVTAVVGCLAVALGKMQYPRETIEGLQDMLLLGYLEGKKVQ